MTVVVEILTDIATGVTGLVYVAQSHHELHSTTTHAKYNVQYFAKRLTRIFTR